MEKDPNDRYALIKGVLMTNRGFLVMFGALRFLLMIEAFCRPLLL